MSLIISYEREVTGLLPSRGPISYLLIASTIPSNITERMLEFRQDELFPESPEDGKILDALLGKSISQNARCFEAEGDRESGFLIRFIQRHHLYDPTRDQLSEIRLDIQPINSGIGWTTGLC